jgi:cysteinylglycine-S-conjugate dipeptidase
MSISTAMDVATHADARFDDAVELLSRYLRLPAISCDKAHHGDVRALAGLVCDDLAALGLDNARVLEVDGALPIVAAEWLKAGPDAPTVLIYGHLDLQPVAGENWTSPPHEPTRRGDRLYARGAADDMGGWVSHMAAVGAWLDVHGALPCNLKIVVEGEEEIGSPNLERYMDAYPEVFLSDIMVLTDCENPSTDVPGLTVSLRGLVDVELTVAAASADVHSGLWGGMVPDSAVALCQIIARLVDDDGRMLVGRADVDDATTAAAVAVPFDFDVVRRGAHLLDGVDPLPHRDTPPAIWMWHQPALTILSTTLPAPGREKNAIRQAASARLSVRLAPTQGADEMVALLRDAVAAAAPAGVKVGLRQVATFGPGWRYVPRGPAFAAADRAYEKSWGCKLVQVGVGGSIPFVALFGRRFGDLPLILNGVMDPETTAHGPDESLHLGVYRKAIAANVHLYAELGALARSEL